MCGIVGILRTDKAPVAREELQSMVSAVSHRGPDGEGIWLDGAVGIGHRRLSIIDLDTGHQPMCNEDGTVRITFNGEIYNFRELRARLEAQGHRFRTRSDTEVVVHAYEQWGDECVRRFRGMFAFGIVDTGKRRLFLARDCFGIKPLYYYEDPSRFAFASELNALKRIEGARLEIDLRALDQYLWLQYIPAPRSIYTNVRKLLPAHRMSVTFDGRASAPERYWRLEFRPNRRKSESDFVDELDSVLRDSVKAHLVSDVPFGAFLSGGVDSSVVVAYMAQVMGRPVRTFSIGFDEPDFDETPHAAVAAARWKTDHQVEILKADALAILPSLVGSYGEPFGDSSAIPTYHVSRLARRAVAMVLSGDGGDEAFGGYNSYLRWMGIVSASPPPDRRPLWKRALRPLAGAILPRRYPPPPPRPGDRLDDWLGLVNYMPPDSRRRLWRPEHGSVAEKPLDFLEGEFRYAKGFAPLHKAQYLDYGSYLPNCILTKVDIASMMSGLEVRTPLVDRQVVEFAATIPQEITVARNGNGVWEGKRVLKRLMERYYPPDHVRRPKAGFSIPVRNWFSPAGSWRGEVTRKLTAPESGLFDYFRPDAVRTLIDEENIGCVWLLLFLDEWLRQDRRRP